VVLVFHLTHLADLKDRGIRLIKCRPSYLAFLENPRCKLLPMKPVLLLLIIGMLASPLTASVPLSELPPNDRPGAGEAEVKALAEWSGKDFRGGGAARVGSSFYGRGDVNMVYGEAEGGLNEMEARVSVSTTPAEALFLYLLALDGPVSRACDIEIAVNDSVLFKGPSTFSNTGWQLRRFPLKMGLLREGENRITIRNTETGGQAGKPPWFMVAAAAIAGESYDVAHLGGEQLPVYRVTLPAERQPMPTPLPAGREAPGFALRGTKGWNWTVEQYLEEIPVLAANGMNFLMNCYLSMFSHSPQMRNEWWQPLSDVQRAGYSRVFRAAREANVDFCFAIHPQLFTPRPMDPHSEEDFENLWQHYQWAQGEGVRWFSLSLDDLHIPEYLANGEPVPIDGALHAGLTNRLFERLRANDPGAQMIFCPTWYWGTGEIPERARYLEALGKTLHPEIFVFWTGPRIVSVRITRAQAEAFRRLVNRRVILWDNYPVNDGHPTMHLGPLTGRDAALHEVLDGYMGNPLGKESRINRLPLITSADYAWNPWEYDPDRSIGQAILQLAQAPEQQRVLTELVETYPGMLFHGRSNPAMNPARESFLEMLLADPAGAVAMINRMRRMKQDLADLFAGQFQATEKALEGDIEWMNAQLAAQAR
jgi:hypothetical protein